MALGKEAKSQIIGHFKKSELDTGSSKVQIALLTHRILELTEHFKVHKKDHHGRLGLVKLVNRRRKLLDYLKRTNLEEYSQTISELKLRK